eukprot:gene15215-16786_t
MAASEALLNGNFLPPRDADKVYKDECLFCFQSPVSSKGLYVSLKSFQGFCHNHVDAFIKKSNERVFLHLKKIPKEVSAEENSKADEPPTKKPTRLAFGVEGGFDVESDKVEYLDANSVIIVDKNGLELERIELPNEKLPQQVLQSIAAILAHQGASMQDTIASWEGDMRKVSKHSNQLLQLDNGVKVPPSGWKCWKCDKVDNLWMNLTDGTILCGRRYFDGSGGNNHAVEYYEETKYPLAVKLGTITAEGADVYSYDEDEMVEDPNLAKHLEHFGINISRMEKTEKTMTELEIEANLTLKAEWDTIQESGKKLVPVYGQGYTGMINLGNTCYMNSVIQVLFSIDEFKERYHKSLEDAYNQLNNSSPADDFEIQMRKLAHGLLSGDYSNSDETSDMENQGIRPRMFKSLIGKDHAEFASNRQQDAHEFFMHLLSTIDKKEGSNPRTSFAFQFEDRIQCMASKKVSYSKREDITLVLPIPLEKATNKVEYEAFEKRRNELEANKQTISSSEVVRLRIPMSSCLDVFMQTDTIDGFYSSAIKAQTQAQRSTRFSTFPDYLVVQFRKFTVGDDWVPKKLDVSIDVAEELDLSALRSTGLQPGEEELSVEDESEPEAEPQIDEAVVLELASMGFAYEGCRKAVYHTKNTGLESAMEWILQNCQNPDFGDRFEIPSSKKSKASSSTFSPNQEAMIMIQSMGFTSEQATRALKATDNNLEQAVEWIFSHGDELAMPMDTDDASQSTAQPEVTYKDGSGKYRLFAFISHMGTSTSCGHYVCHIFKDERQLRTEFNYLSIAMFSPLSRSIGLYCRQVPTRALSSSLLLPRPVTASSVAEVQRKISSVNGVQYARTFVTQDKQLEMHMTEPIIEAKEDKNLEKTSGSEVAYDDSYCNDLVLSRFVSLGKTVLQSCLTEHFMDIYAKLDAAKIADLASHVTKEILPILERFDVSKDDTIFQKRARMYAEVGKLFESEGETSAGNYIKSLHSYNFNDNDVDVFCKLAHPKATLGAIMRQKGVAFEVRKVGRKDVSVFIDNELAVQATASTVDKATYKACLSLLLENYSNEVKDVSLHQAEKVFKNVFKDKFTGRRVVTLSKDVNGHYGLFLKGGEKATVETEKFWRYNYIEPVYISKIAEGSPAAEGGLLQEGDVILAVGDFTLKGMTLANAIRLMNREDEVVLTVKFDSKIKIQEGLKEDFKERESKAFKDTLKADKWREWHEAKAKEQPERYIKIK